MRDKAGIETKPLLYLAAPLFSVAERRFNEEIASSLANHFTVYLPQRDGGLFTELVRDRGFSSHDAAQQIFAIDIRALNAANAVLAILDGRAIDEGVALEIGYAYARGKPCYGVQTDSRRLLPEGNNPMVTGVLRKTALGLDELDNLVKEMLESIVTST